MNILILAGGTGTRLWPASRQAKPKQLLPFLGQQTLLQNTYTRCLRYTDPSHIFVGTLTDYFKSIHQQLPGLPVSHYSLEPALRDRGPAIGLAALIMDHQQPNSNFVTAWSDHFIQPEKNYIALLKKADQYIHKHPTTTMTVGVMPQFAHSGLGYIEIGRTVADNNGLNLYHVKSFKEKPSQKTAQAYVKSGRYLWNAAYFIWNTRHLLNLYAQHLPDIYRLLLKIKPALGTKQQQAAINKIYPHMPKVDIETGLVEKITNRVAIVADFSWADIGSWRALKEVLSTEGDNLINGLWAGTETSNTLVYNYTSRLVATAGITDGIIVVTDDIVLVASKEKGFDIKQLIKTLAADKKLKKFL